MAGEYQQQYQQFQRDPGQLWSDKVNEFLGLKSQVLLTNMTIMIFTIGLPMVS